MFFSVFVFYRQMCRWCSTYELGLEPHVSFHDVTREDPILAAETKVVIHIKFVSDLNKGNTRTGANPRTVGWQDLAPTASQPKEAPSFGGHS